MQNSLTMDEFNMIHFNNIENIYSKFGMEAFNACCQSVKAHTLSPEEKECIARFSEKRIELTNRTLAYFKSKLVK